jgi:fumarylacetoacetase
MLNETHDAAATSWVESANAIGSDFPIQNLPFGMYRRRGALAPATLGVAIGDQVLDVRACGASYHSLNDLLARHSDERSHLRLTVHRLLRADASAAERRRVAALLTPIGDAELMLPIDVGDFTDFFGSIFHAANAAAMMRPGEPLFPNYRTMPLGYHARASTIVVAGTAVRRPYGVARRRQIGVTYAATRRLDYEAELGFVIGRGNDYGSPIAIDRARDHVGGVCLINDWSARDIQAWESDPLGPFLAKSFATTISPWVVTIEALEPFRVAAIARAADDPELPAYLVSPADRQDGALRIMIEVWLQSSAMRQSGMEPLLVSRSDSATLYWTSAQLVAHHTSNGCNLRTGDLLGSGTVSGAERTTWACLLELTRGGKEPIPLPDGDSRTFLQDGDEVIIRARCEAAGARSIGFGECRGRIYGADGSGR